MTSLDDFRSHFFLTSLLHYTIPHDIRDEMGEVELTNRQKMDLVLRVSRRAVVWAYSHAALGVFNVYVAILGFKRYCHENNDGSALTAACIMLICAVLMFSFCHASWMTHERAIILHNALAKNLRNPEKTDDPDPPNMRIRPS